MTRSARRVFLAILCSFIILSSMVGPFVGGALAAAPTDQTATGEAIQPQEPVVVQDVETVNITDDLAVWKYAPLRPAVVDRSDAATTIDSQTVYLERNNIAEISTSQEAVFQQGTQVTFELAPQTGADTSEFSGQEFKILVTRIDADQDTTEVFLDAQNVTVEEVERALEDVDGYDEFNQSVQNQNEVRFGTVRDFFEGTEEFEQFADSFEANQTLTTGRLEQALTSEEFLNLTEFRTTSGGEIRSDGSQEANIDLDKAGTYLLIGHVGGEVYEEGDDRPRFNGTTVLSIDGVTAQESASSIDVATTDGEVEAGDNVSVDATANLDANGNVSHTVVVMDEDTFSQSSNRIVVDDEFSRDLRAENVTVNSTIAQIQGVTNVEPNVRISGTTITPERFAGTLSTEDQADSFFDIRNALVDGFDIRDQAGDAAEFNAIGETTLNASMTAVGNASGEETIVVETLDEWETGEYTVLHIASDQQDGTVSTSRTTIDIVDSIDTDEPGGPSVPSDPGDDDDNGDDEDGVETPPDIDAPVDVELPELPAGVNVLLNETANIEVVPESNRSRATFGENNTVESVLFDFEVRGSINARMLDREPAETGPAPGVSVAVVQISVGNELRNSSATIRMRVSKERLDEIDADAEDLRINRFADGEWQGLETTVVNETGTHVRIEAQTPGFSYFAASAVSEPEAVASVSSETVEPGEEVELSGAESTNQYGDIVAYDWNVAGETLTGETVTTSVDETGTVEAELTVTNDAGETDTATVSFAVEEPAGDGTGDGTGDGAGDGTGDGTGDGPTQEPGGFPTVAVILVIFVLAAVAAVALYARREE